MITGAVWNHNVFAAQAHENHIALTMVTYVCASSTSSQALIFYVFYRCNLVAGEFSEASGGRVRSCCGLISPVGHPPRENGSAGESPRDAGFMASRQRTAPPHIQRSKKEWFHSMIACNFFVRISDIFGKAPSFMMIRHVTLASV